ncbi:DUF1028 domain-containing protein [Pantoea allii]|uniref:DUF1028 domain-containing protein n=1 Tax=Pantoea allii TaxID=574096 RepID=A0A2V2BC77_9GAMM|nr:MULTISPECIES: DUF1028 domain-containing protein [Pantoea]MBW1213862.1 DUF1028 domain-containing protein [Pantoea allii]MBW1255259.1 DUF1028 domain-containing protein [Pantoea allii]MBW1259675.1 DUF1028 domain-containing protein [Pantoea allii]MBW1262484.1 DUF1028 domain-containing protein [Pantoea allii]MBW1268848.1 DUF1028 domain-containing protein [Pantoea allii]
MTLSVTARCEETGQLGIAISSSSIAVGARCPWLQAGVGAVASQNITLPSLGQQILVHLDQGRDLNVALKLALADDRFSDYRQVAAIDIQGNTAFFSGSKTLGIGSVTEGKNCIAAGNMLADKGVTAAMCAAYDAASGELASRLLAALQAGVAAGGEAGPLHSAALKLVDDYTWPLVDLRIDWTEHDPVGQLTQLWLAYEPQMEAYVTRALDPREAPAYGVPGDE